MARPLKNGVDYFPLDTVLDTKFELIEAEFGLTGFAVVVKLLQKIYRENGYYCEWTKEVALLFSKQVNEGYNAVSEIVSASVKRGIFDKDLFHKYGILTSTGIQKRYFEAVNRRAQIVVKKEYLLVSDTQIRENVNINFENVDNNSKNVDNNTQTKLNKTKLNEIKQKERVAVVVKAYQDNIGFVSPAVYEKISAWLDDVDESLIVYAIEQAVLNNKATWAYINGILNNHFKSGRKTRAEAERALKESPKEEKKSRYDYEEIERQMFMNVQKKSTGGDGI